MMIKLTNATDIFKGKPLLINPRHIISIFEAELEGEAVTQVYSITKESWQVTETVDQIHKMVKALKVVYA